MLFAAGQYKRENSSSYEKIKREKTRATAQQQYRECPSKVYRVERGQFFFFFLSVSAKRLAIVICEGDIPRSASED